MGEVFKAKVCLDNEQHLAKFKNLEKWIGEKEAYLKAKDECLFVSQAQENLQTIHAYKQENDETTNGDVVWLKNLGKSILSAEYKNISSYSFENPEDIKSREK